MLSRKLRKQLKQDDLSGHPECSHNWVHHASEQAEWSGYDSRSVAYMYICTMCQSRYWSSNKTEKIPYYVCRLKEKTKEFKMKRSNLWKKQT